MDWFPDDHAHAFYVLKGVLALAGTVLLVAHMARKREPMTLGQLLRYCTLLYLAALITGASADQSQSHAAVNWYNLAVIPGVVLLIVAAVVSLHESRNRR